MVGWTLWIAAHVAFAVFLVYRAARPVRCGQVVQWAAGYGLGRGEGIDRDQAAKFLHRSRWFRTAGFLLPFVVGTSTSFTWALVFTEPRPPFPFDLLDQPAWIAGYLLGAILAEVTWSRPRVPPAAALLPRRVSDYIRGSVLVLIRVAALATIAVGVLTHWIYPGHVAEPFRLGPGPAVTAAAVLVTTEAALRFMAHRRQPVGSTSQLTLDDALRSTSIHRTAGAGLALLFLLLGVELFSLGGGTDISALRVTLPWVGLVCIFFCAPASWLHIGHPRLWLVRRSAPRRANPPTEARSRTAT